MVQTTALAIFSSWTLGGMERWSQNWILVLALLGLPLVVLRYRETREFAWHPFVPALLWCVFTGLALANPSHVWLLGRGWAPRDDWIRWLPVTVDRPHSVMDARIWLSALLQGGILRSVLRSTRAAKLIWGAVALNAFALAVTGAVFYFSGAQQVLGFIEPPEKTYFFSTFFYKNHWAAFGALGGVAALALSLRQGRAALRGDPVARGRMMLFAAVGMLILITLPLPGSRSGVLLGIVLAGGFLLLIFRLIWSTRTTSWLGRGAILLALVLATTALGTYALRVYGSRAAFDLQRTRAQLAHGLDAENLDVRMPVARDTWRMARERPWFGWGPGSFEIVFPRFMGSYMRRPDGQATARFEFAHNDWLQLLAEIGVIGATMLLTPVLLTAGRAWSRAGPSGRAALLGCALMGAYAWIDFPFHNPAVLLLWTVLLTGADRLSPRD